MADKSVTGIARLAFTEMEALRGRGDESALLMVFRTRRN